MSLAFTYITALSRISGLWDYFGSTGLAHWRRIRFVMYEC